MIPKSFRNALVQLLLAILTACSPALPAPKPNPTPAARPSALPAYPPASAPTMPVVAALATAAPANGPQIVNRTPFGIALSDRRPTILITFDRLMNRASVAASIKVEPSVPLDLSWEGEILSLRPREPLTPGIDYKFSLAPSAAALDGRGLAAEYRWHYRIARVISLHTQPSLNTPRARLTISFNYPMNEASFEQALTITPPVAGRWTWMKDSTQAIFTPESAFTGTTRYTVSFEGQLRDAHGDALPPQASFKFQTPPPILSVSPDTSGAAVATFIKIDFARPMNHAAAEAAFSIQPATPGTFEWQESSLLFTPTAGYFEEQTKYKVTIAASAQAADGSVIMGEDYQWSFRTGSYQVEASFGLGPNAQVMSSGGRRAIQFILEQHGPVPVTFDLYQLTLEQFLDLYSSSFRGVRGYEKQTLETTGLPLVTNWQFDSTSPSVVNSFNLQVRETLLPPEVAPGAYVLNMSSRAVQDQLLLLVSERAITVKQAEGQLTAWVTRADGSPAPNVEVGVYARDAELLRQGRTNDLGLFQTVVNGDPQPLIVIAHEGNDLTASGLAPEWESAGNVSRPWWQPAPAVFDYAAYIYTERPIYRPGQTVYYKAIVRRDDDAVLSVVPAGTVLTARIRDARNNVVQTRALLADQFGAVHGEFNLAEGAMLGDYAVEISLEGESHRQIFKVQDYRKPDYAVSLTTDAQQYVAGDTIQVAIEAGYFLGEPVPGAKVTVKQYQLGLNYYCYEACTDDYRWLDVSENERHLRTNAEGVVTFEMPANLYEVDPDSGWPNGQRHTTWGIEVTVDDGSHQVVSSFATVEVYRAAQELRLNTGGYFKTPGQPFTVQAEAQTIFGEALPNQSLRLEFLEWNSSTGDYDTLVQWADLDTGADGAVSADIVVEQAGYYRVQLVDRQSKAAGYQSWLWVFDEAALWGGESDAGLLSLVAEKETYAPGDTARLLVQSSFNGPALLTFERGTLRREQLVTLTAPHTWLEIPMLAEDVPNLFVSLAAWQPQDTTLAGTMTGSLADSRLHTAQLELHVPATHKALNLTLTPGQPVYAPREEATFTVRVTDADGQPVSGADVSLALVDEAIFSLSEELSGSIFEAFYFERENLVHTYDAMALRRTLWRGCECGGGGGGGYLEPGDPRSQFPDTAAWLPSVRTNAAGEATVTFTLPDNLTSWRLTARANTPATQVGEAYINIVTHQPLVVRPLLPRKLTAGDQIELSAMVQNYSHDTQSIVVSIEAAGLQFTAPISQTIQLAPGEQRIVGWPAEAMEAGQAQIVVRAVAGELSDAVQLPLQIDPLAVRDVTTAVGDFSGAFDTRLVWPANALNTSHVRLELSRSIAGSLLNGVEYLTGFPYGCVEQTMSKALPNAVVGRAFHQLGIGNAGLPADLPPKINASIQRLYGFQHNDGGWGWWYDDRTDAYQTAWVIFGLSVTAEAGYEVDSGVIRRGVEWLSGKLGGMDEPTRAFALYSMAVAGYGDLGPTQAMAAKADKLDAFSQAALALALHELGAAPEAEAMLDRLATKAVVKDGWVYWPGAAEDGHYNAKIMSSTTRSTALALDAFVRIAPNHPFEGGIVRYLMAQRRDNGWGSTNETSFAILALTDHLLAKEADTADTAYTVELNGQVIAEGTLGRGEPAVTVEIPAGQMHGGENDLSIRQSGDSQLYYVLSSQVDLARTTIQAAGPVRVFRNYLDAETNKPLTGPVTVGQLVKVQVVVTLSSNTFYLIVEDQLPGGLEALNESLNTSSHEGLVTGAETFYWEHHGYNNKEVFGDRVSFFITQLTRGRHTYTYLARATRPGTFVALPASAWAMYDLTVWGRSGSRQVTIAK